jgi:hypothetical protein
MSPAISSAHATQWQANEDPSRLSSAYIFSLDALPLTGMLPRTPWSDTYWPDQDGSIDNRWNNPHPIGFGFTPPTLVQARAMTRDQLSRLSPAEKYDLFAGRYDYPLFNEVHANHYVTTSAPEWAGICDGWSMASAQFSEPKATDVPNPDGIVIPFGSSDVKGLLSYAMAYHFRSHNLQIGANCTTSSCTGLNAGAFHIALTNQIGILHQSLIIDRSTTNEIWNQPVYGYSLHVVGSAAPEAGVRGVHVQGEIYYADELDAPSFDPVLGTIHEQTVTMPVDYTLDIDSSGNIIGGSFGRRSARPDSIWFPVSTFEFGDYFSGLSSVYHP